MPFLTSSEKSVFILCWFAAEAFEKWNTRRICTALVRRCFRGRWRCRGLGVSLLRVWRSFPSGQSEQGGAPLSEVPASSGGAATPPCRCVKNEGGGEPRARCLTSRLLQLSWGLPGLFAWPGAVGVTVCLAVWLAGGAGIPAGEFKYLGICFALRSRLRSA